MSDFSGGISSGNEREGPGIIRAPKCDHEFSTIIIPFFLLVPLKVDVDFIKVIHYFLNVLDDHRL